MNFDDEFAKGVVVDAIADLGWQSKQRRVGGIGGSTNVER
jgi:hypothetical protein